MPAGLVVTSGSVVSAFVDSPATFCVSVGLALAVVVSSAACDERVVAVPSKTELMTVSESRGHLRQEVIIEHPC